VAPVIFVFGIMLFENNPFDPRSSECLSPDREERAFPSISSDSSFRDLPVSKG